MSVELCSSSMASDMEEAGSESSRKMKDMEETTSEASWTAVTKGKEKEVWRLEPEGGAERFKAPVPWNEAEGFSVNPEGEGRNGQARAKMARKEREIQTKIEEKVDGKGGCGVRKEKVFQVESEETQDYVRESLNLRQEDAEEPSFVPSAISIPQKPMFWCDNRCSDKASRFWQFASVVVEDVKESYTVNLCQQCCNERLTAQGLAPLKNWQWKAVVEKKAHRGGLWRMFGKDKFIQEMWEHFSLARAKAIKILRDAEKEKQEGTQGQWQRESPAKEFLEQVK